ncbi:MAG: hypothetical protein GF405_07915, partial [Candidatus Eisenbacteria bacterium]|nr:hypothetical protein [Candidatus Eisenbacteria bacterium]
PTVIRTVSWIESNYTGGSDTAERIRMFLQDAYATWGTTYVLLGGDTNVVPVRYAWTGYYGGDSIPADLYFSDLDGNWNGDGDDLFGEADRGITSPGDSVDLYPDILVGRAPVTDAVGAEVFVDKCLTYEKAPTPHFTDRNLYLAEVLFPYDWQSGAYSFDGGEDIINKLPSSVPDELHEVKLFANHEEFPESYPLDQVAAADSIERGYNVVTHVGHGNKDILRVGYNNYLTMSDMSTFANGRSKASVFWLLNCTSAAIDFDCIAERCIENPTGGGVAAVGPTRYAFPATLRHYYWDWLDILYTDADPRAGSVFAECKARHASQAESGTDNTDRWSQLSLLYLGDPELPIYTGRIDTFAVAHDTDCRVGDSSITVSVADPDPVEGALVCVQKGDEVYAYALTGPSGEAVVPVRARTTGSLALTVTALDYFPYEATVDVLPAENAVLALDSWSIDDDGSGGSDGNGNGAVEAGETVELDVVFANDGVAAASVQATLSTSDPYVTIEDDTATTGTLGPGATISVPAAFRLAVSESAPDEHDAVFTLEIDDGLRAVRADTFAVRLFAPEVRVLTTEIDDSAGDGDGVAEVGETVDLLLEIANDGHGVAVGLHGVLHYPGPEATVTDSLDTWGDLIAGASALGTGGFTVDIAGALNSHLRLQLSDGRGGEWTSFLDLAPPGVSDSLWGDVKGTTIELAWTPVDDADLMGYDVLRSQDPSGPYVRANGGPLGRIGYFEDTGLLENTVYHYCVAAIDSSGNRGARSETLNLSTNPPSLEGWPLQTSGSMYASPAVADLDGDGDLEIVVASVEIYAWHHDGLEYMDGDGDPRTNGVFAVDGTGGYRASPAVGEIDGDPGLEIVAPAWQNVGSDSDPIYEVWAWNAEDGSVVPGWPTATMRFCWASPALADLDGDGRSEVLQACSDGYLYCWHGTGSEYMDGDGDPLTMGRFRSLSSEWCYGSTAVADVDGDRSPEIFQSSTCDSIFGWNADGSRLPGWPIYVSRRSETSPAIGDVDLDGAMEIAVSAQGGKVWLVEADGTPMPGWPVVVTISGDFPPSPVLADIDGNGTLEVVILSSDGRMLIKDHEGTTLHGWPQDLPDGTLSSPVVADIDGDEEFEIVVGCKDGAVYCWNADGTVPGGWPIRTDAEVNSTPTVADLDGDGDNEVIVGGMDTAVYVWDCEGLYDDGEGVEWGMFLHDAARTQFYGHEDPVGVHDTPEWVDAHPLRLEQNHPNPFNPMTTITYEVPGLRRDEKRVTLRIYNVDGSVVRTLVDRVARPGKQSVLWDGRDDDGHPVSSGVYFYRLTSHDAATERRMILIK